MLSNAYCKNLQIFEKCIFRKCILEKCIFRKCIFRKCIFRKCIFRKFSQIFWRARSRLYQNEILQVNMRLTAFFKLYEICILLHRCNLKIFAKNRFEKSAIFVKTQQQFCKCRKICKILPIFKKTKLDDLVDSEKCCKTRIFLQKSVPIQPKTSNILPTFCRNFAKNWHC